MGVTVPTIGALALQLTLGLAVYQANSKRLANQCFLLLSLAISSWLCCLLVGSTTGSAKLAEFCIRQASAAGVLYLAALNLLRLSIRKNEHGWSGIVRHSRTWLACTVAITVLCQTPWFLKSVEMADTVGLAPQPLYGGGVWPYSIYFIVAFLVLIFNYGRDLKNTKGVEYAELSFILIGAVAAVAFALLLSFVLDYFLGPARALWFAPFRIIFLSLVMAYGIATRKILEVGFFMRRAISYGVLTTYLVVLYALIWWLCYSVFVPLLGPDGRSLSHVIAAVVIAFAMAPARGVSRSLADRLFLGTRRLDFQATMSQAAAILRSVTTLGDLLERFGLTIGQAVDTERVFLLLPEPEFYAQRYPTVQAGSRTTRMELHRDQAIIAHLERTQEPIVVDELHRAFDPALERGKRQMNALQVAVAMGMFSREQLAGVMLLGARRSGRIYGTVEQNAISVLCGQLAVAIENAQLFTEVQNARIYNETLLQNLTTGVVAADQDRLITVFNHEVEQITGLPASELLGRRISNLPDTLRDILGETLSRGERQHDREIVLHTGEKARFARQ